MILPAEKIKIVSDFRLGKRDLSELALSIKQRGLLQPMLLTGIEGEDGVYEVAAGRSRFKAMTEILGYQEFEEGKHFIIKEDIDPLVVQLEENIKRKDFAPLEVAYLISTIHKQKVSEHGASVPGVSGGWSAKDTGKLVGLSSSAISGYLKMWKNRDLVEEGMTAGEALEKIRTERASNMINKVRKVIAEKVKEKVKDQADTLVETCIGNFKCMDAVEYLSGIDEVDHVITDPPYGIGYDDITKGASDYGNYEDDEDVYWQLMEKVVPEFGRIVKNGFVVIWCGYEQSFRLKELMIESGIKCARMPLAWLKTGSAGFTAKPDKILGNVFEVAIYGWRGNPEIRMKGRRNVFEAPVVKSDRVHVAQKPDSLNEKLLGTFTKKGDSVLDCFGGSGSMLRACIKKKRIFYGCELQEEFYHSAIKLTGDLI